MSFLTGVLGGAAGLIGGNQIGKWLQGDSSKADALGPATAQQGAYATEDRNRYLTALNGGQEALDTSTRAAVSSALPSYLKDLQGTRESAIRRGASNGDLATSYEGDLSSAFDRNIATATAGQAAGMYGQKLAGYGGLAGRSSDNYLDLLNGGADREQADRNNRYGIFSGLLGAGAKAAGAYAGGH